MLLLRHRQSNDRASWGSTSRCVRNSKIQVIAQLTTAERLTLLEQIFAPQGECSRVEFASCTLSDMDFMFDFAEANLVEMKWSKDECELGEIIERTKHLLSPEVEQKLPGILKDSCTIQRDVIPLLLTCLIPWTE